MRTGYSQSQKTGAAIAVHFAVCILVCSILGLGLYTLFQPRRMSNLGLAAYKPPPATVINYPAASQFARAQSEPPEPVTEVTSPAQPDETTGRGAHVADPTPATDSPHALQVKKRPPAARNARVHSASRRAHEQVLPRPQASGLVAAYPGYGAIH